MPAKKTVAQAAVTPVLSGRSVITGRVSPNTFVVPGGASAVPACRFFYDCGEPALSAAPAVPAGEPSPENLAARAKASRMATAMMPELR